MVFVRFFLCSCCCETLKKYSCVILDELLLCILVVNFRKW